MACVMTTADGPFVVLLSQDGANEATHLEQIQWVEWEAGEGQDVASRRKRPEVARHPVELGVYLCGQMVP